MTSASASRVTRSSRALRLAVLLFAGALSVVTVLRAQEPAPAPAGTPAAPASGPATAAASTAGDAAPDGASSAQPVTVAPDEAATAPAPKGPSPSRFEPTEKVRADFDVSFPIDI
jgi:hypothetical protein